MNQASKASRRGDDLHQAQQHYQQLVQAGAGADKIAAAMQARNEALHAYLSSPEEVLANVAMANNTNNETDHQLLMQMSNAHSNLLAAQNSGNADQIAQAQQALNQAVSNWDTYLQTGVSFSAPQAGNTQPNMPVDEFLQMLQGLDEELGPLDDLDTLPDYGVNTYYRWVKGRRRSSVGTGTLLALYRYCGGLIWMFWVPFTHALFPFVSV